MKELLEKIDKLVYEVKNDTNRTKIIDLGIELLELSKLYGESKKEQIRLKNEYEREEVMKKEQREQYMTKKYEDEYQKELVADPKKAKRKNVTDAEITRLAGLELIKIKDDLSEARMNTEYLEPILKGYYEIINLIKFSDKELIRPTTFNGQLK